MDPRHPELAVSRMKELLEQYDRILNQDIARATIAAKLAQAEREGGLVVQEICLVSPRLHEALIQASRNRRHDLAHGVVIDMSKYEIPAGALEEPEVIGDSSTIIAVDEYTTEEAEVVKKEAKPKAKKRTTKKKKAEE